MSGQLMTRIGLEQVERKNHLKMETNSKQVSQNIKTVKKLAKFKVLKKNEAFLNRISIHLDASSNPTNNCLALLTGYYILIVMLIGLIISGAPIFTYLSDIKSVLGALKICIAVIQCGGIFFGVKLKVTETKALQSELQQIVNSGISILCFLHSYHCCEI